MGENNRRRKGRDKWLSKICTRKYQKKNQQATRENVCVRTREREREKVRQCVHVIFLCVCVCGSEF